MVSLLHEDQVYRRLFPRIQPYLLLRPLIEQEIKVVENLAELEIVVEDNVVFIRSSLRHLERECKMLLGILIVPISVDDVLFHLEVLIDVVQYF